jgi:hypothetical protein
MLARVDATLTGFSINGGITVELGNKLKQMLIATASSESDGVTRYHVIIPGVSTQFSLRLLNCLSRGERTDVCCHFGLPNILYWQIEIRFSFMSKILDYVICFV